MLGNCALRGKRAGALPAQAGGAVARARLRPGWRSPGPRPERAPRPVSLQHPAVALSARVRGGGAGRAFSPQAAALVLHSSRDAVRAPSASVPSFAHGISSVVDRASERLRRSHFVARPDR